MSSTTQTESIGIKNYRCFRDIVLDDLPHMTVVVGANGSGKSSLFDVFTFLKDALTQNVASAVARRGGYRELVSRGQEGPIEISVKFRKSGGPLATYQLHINTQDGGRVVVDREVLSYRRGQRGRAWHFVDFSRGSGRAITNESVYGTEGAVEERVLQAMRRRVPGVSGVEAKPTEDGRLVLRFQDGSFTDPFIARYVSDGTIKMFAYLVLLYDPKPHPLLAIEEPENQLYPDLMYELVEEFRDYARRGGQVFVSTHSPAFLNGAQLNEICWLVKENGFTTVQRASTNELLQALVNEGDLPGALWRQGFFQGAGPTASDLSQPPEPQVARLM